MRIVYACGYSSSVSGGVQTVVPQYIKYMSKYMDVLVLSLGGAEFDITENVKILQNKEEQFSLDEKIDIVIFHEVYYLKYYSFAKKLCRLHIPYIIIPHGSLTKGAQSQKKVAKRIFNLLWVNQFVKQALFIQFLSEGERQSSLYSDKKYLIIPNGVEITEKHKRETNQDTGMKLLFVGRLSIFYKGLDLLIKGCQLIKNEMKKNHIYLDIYGTDFEGGKAKLEGMVMELGLQECVAIHGGVFGVEKENVILEHDLFIQTSRSEGQPMGILEAMQYGVPLLVTPGTTFGNIVEKYECGWRIEENPESIATGILKAYEEKEKWNILGHNARKLAMDEYSWEAVVKKTIQEYNKNGNC